MPPQFLWLYLLSYRGQFGTWEVSTSTSLHQKFCVSSAISSLFFIKKNLGLYHTACRIWVPRLGFEPVAPAVEAQSFNYSTTRETSLLHLFTLKRCAYTQPQRVVSTFAWDWFWLYYKTIPRVKSFIGFGQRTMWKISEQRVYTVYYLE